MEEPLTASKTLLKLLKQNAVNRLSVESNSREVQTFSDVILHFVDTADYMSPELPESIREQFEIARNQLEMANTPANYEESTETEEDSDSD